MNFDNDGKALRATAPADGGLCFSVCVGGRFFPSFGINSRGVFYNDLLVDETGKAKYLRKSEKRIASTHFIQEIIERGYSYEEALERVLGVEVVNNPNMCSHNMIVSPLGDCFVAEHGLPLARYPLGEAPFVVLTNFALTTEDGSAAPIAGGGSDRYERAQGLLGASSGAMGADGLFKVLAAVSQPGPAWKTVLSLVYDARESLALIKLAGTSGGVFSYDLRARELRSPQGAAAKLCDLEAIADLGMGPQSEGA
jgi:hypothetical protein